MKKIIILLLIFLFPFLSYAGTVQEKLCGVLAKKNSASSCNPASDAVGDKGEYAAQINTGNNDFVCSGPWTPTCSGTLGYGYARKYDTDADSFKMCVYKDDGDNTPDTGDTKVSCSSGKDTSTAGWNETTDKLGGSVTTGSAYWVCTVSNLNGFRGMGQSTGDSRYCDIVDLGYATPPDTLDSGSCDSSAEYSAYVVIE